jgi:hypothetical protein
MDLNWARLSCGLDRPEVHVTQSLNVACSAFFSLLFNEFFENIPKKPFEMVAAHFQISQEFKITHKTF